ncbi:TlpA family protein disulfide reductase [Sphingomonas sp. Sphisp140]|uniref:TlpA family protein disulfide reductase n=1 Tax=unclassified Sphingomonas TaxID=196159 RepID=UPI0039B0BDC4
MGISALYRRLALVVLPLSLLGAAPAPVLAPMFAQIKVGQPAPPFVLRLIKGGKVSLDELRGNVIVLNFWATWCVPCRTELPALDAYYVLRKDAGLRVFAVTTEDSLQPFRLKKLFEAMHIDPVRSIKGPYDVLDNGVPTNIVIDRNGVVRYAKAGAFDTQALDQLLVPLLNEKVK